MIQSYQQPTDELGKTKRLRILFDLKSFYCVTYERIIKIMNIPNYQLQLMIKYTWMVDTMTVICQTYIIVYSI